VKISIPVNAASPVQAARAPQGSKGNGTFAPWTSDLSAGSAQTFNTVLVAVGDSKLDVTWKVREITGLDLVSARLLIEDAPAIIKDGIARAEAEAVKAALEKVGATAVVQPHRVQRGNGHGQRAEARHGA
jgi:large subunit ribosomal protein L7/L12